MTELIQAIMEASYHVPEQTESEKRLYDLRNEASEELGEMDNLILDGIGELVVDAMCDAAENGFMQGMLTGIELVCALRHRE